MFRKGLSFAVFFFVVSVGIAWDVMAQAPQELYARGMQAVRQGRYPQAIQNLQRAVTLQPDYAEAHAALGTIYLQHRDFPAAEKALTLAVNINPDLIQAEANLAALYTKTERLDDAIRVYRNLVQKNPESLQVRLGIASAYQQAERFPEAIEAYLESLKRSPNLAAAMTNLASCYEAVEDDEQAIHYYKAALAVAPNLPMANGNLGALYQEQGELDKALPLLETAIRQNPQFTAARYRLGLVFTKKREFQRAATEYQRVIAQQRDHVGAYYNLAQALFRLKKREEGKRAMDAYHRLNEIAQEIDTRERATLMEPSNPVQQYRLGLVYAKYGKMTEAISAFQAALKLDGNAHYALNGLARLYILQKIQLQDAVAYAEKAFRLSPAPQYLQTLALAHFRMGASEKALKAIHTAIKMEPENEAFQQTLTEIQESDEKTK
ncbi:MAG: tetratricopeptide repeat protein [Candidatus Poribacteria bacterium]|nr:tetratricopeptide repeat protein [Candidatus Poribacteria bacterium]